MLTLKQGIKLSAIIDKLDIQVTNAKSSQEAVGADLIMQVVKKAYKAEQEIYTFVAEIKKCTIQEAEEIDLISFIKELFSDATTAGFFKSAAKSNVQE
ncbi:hypothetical protein [Bacillus sp. ISL-46]|uniref:hypothetical protein n=1 Tax=Bacillus sp. ISL-46 TaxID=2819129 RepID=UPI001BEC377F|nr:hypothetical protein [Bacillus sp. ISL-46]MBT2722316.1 hypothetical protein [Bacillus sp. ISL-46]